MSTGFRARVVGVLLLMPTMQIGVCEGEEQADSFRSRRAEETEARKSRRGEDGGRPVEYLNYELGPNGGKTIPSGTVPSDQARKTVEGTVVPWRESQNFTNGDFRCGVKALFVFLRLHGANVSVPEIEGELNVGDKGVDMLQLRDVARKQGGKAIVAKCTPAELQGNLPAIARLSMGTGSESNHYHVVSHLSDTHVGYVEPTTCRFEQSSAAAFTRHFTGHALVVESGLMGTMGARWFVSVVGFQVVAIGVMLARRRILKIRARNG